MSKQTKPRAPANLGTSGRRLWAAVVGEFELMPHELPLLREVVRTVDLLDELAARVAEDGELVDTEQGPKVHPAVVEQRQQRTVLGRLLVTLRLPEDWAELESRPQRRGAARGPYGSRRLGGGAR